MGTVDEMVTGRDQATDDEEAKPARVYLVATGEVHEGQETYTRHDGAPPPMCDAECLYARASMEQGETSTLRSEVKRFTELLSENEWAEHLSSDQDAQELESQITRVIGELEVLRRQAQDRGRVTDAQVVQMRDGLDVTARVVAEASATQPRLTVRLTSFPESNGKRNWTALLVRSEAWEGLVGNCGGVSLARGELWNRVAYHAECARLLIGERDTEPDILDYGDDIGAPEEWGGEVRGGRALRQSCRSTAPDTSKGRADA